MSDPRIDPSDVEETLSSKAAQKVDADDLARAVTVGHAIVEKVDTSDYDTGTLEIAEAEAAAHWIMTHKVRQTKQQSVGNASKTFAATFGKELESTTHGQMLTTLIPDVKQATKPTASISVPRTR